MDEAKAKERGASSADEARESLEQFGARLEASSEKLRAIQESVERFDANLEAVSEELDTLISADEERKALLGRLVWLVAIVTVGVCLVLGHGFAVGVGWGLVAWVAAAMVARVVHAEMKVKG